MADKTFTVRCTKKPLTATIEGKNLPDALKKARLDPEKWIEVAPEPGPEPVTSGEDS